MVNIQELYDASMPERPKRYLRFFELWHSGNWIIKIYIHSTHSDEVSIEFAIDAKAFIQFRISELEQSGLLHRVGFLILAQGAVSNWIMLNWWSSFQLYQKIFSADGAPPHRFSPAPADLLQCAYDLRITAFESEAWRTHVVENPQRDIQSYLESLINAEV